MSTLYLDIETTSDKANKGRVVAIGILSGGEPEVRYAASFDEEAELLKWLKKKIEGCKMLVTWYGSGFDIPFLLTRSIVHGIELGELPRIPMLDLCEWSRAHLLLSSYSLESVAGFLGFSWSKKFHGAEILTLVKMDEQGNREGRKLIIEHCKEDILALKLIHEKLRPVIELVGKK